jgi:hypothetical protein
VSRRWLSAYPLLPRLLTSLPWLRPLPRPRRGAEVCAADRQDRSVAVILRCSCCLLAGFFCSDLLGAVSWFEFPFSIPRICFFPIRSSNPWHINYTSPPGLCGVLDRLRWGLLISVSVVGWDWISLSVLRSFDAYMGIVVVQFLILRSGQRGEMWSTMLCLFQCRNCYLMMDSISWWTVDRPTQN